MVLQPKEVRPQKKEHTTLSPLLLDAFLERWGSSAVLVANQQSTVLYASNRLLSLLGSNSKGVVGKPLSQVLWFEDASGVALSEEKLPFTLALRHPGFAEVVPYFCYLRTVADKRLHVALRMVWVELGKQAKQCIIGIREVKRDLDINETKTLFASFAAHQLKTPSGIVKGFLELLLRDGEKNFKPGQWENLLSAYEANERLIRRSRTLLNVTKLEGGMLQVKLAHFKPLERIEQVLSTYGTLLRYRQIQVKIMSKENRECYTDPEIFLEIFDILFNNAIKYSRTGSSITIKCKTTDSLLQFSVTDQGPGMSVAASRQLFKIAQSGAHEHNSHGLGLYMAKKYLALVKGSIEVESKLEKGTTFSVTFPTYSQ